MLKVSQIMRIDVYQPKRDGARDVSTLDVSDLAIVGCVHQVVFSPQGDRVEGFLVRRPDVAGMVRREDAFLARDSFDVCDAGLVASRGKESFDDAARERLGLDWDACILWTGMDAKTTDGKELGWVNDATFHPKSGRVQDFSVGDGSVAESLVGSVVIPADMLEGYRDGYMLVDPAAADLALDGGLAAVAGQRYAQAKAEGKQVAARVGKAAGSAVEKGSKRAARAVGKQLGKTRGMFGAFMDEYRKASK